MYHPLLPNELRTPVNAYTRAHITSIGRTEHQLASSVLSAATTFVEDDRLVNERNIIPLRYVCFEPQVYAASVAEANGRGGSGGGGGSGGDECAKGAKVESKHGDNDEGKGKLKLIPHIDLQAMAEKVRAAKHIRAGIVGSISYLIPLIELVGEDEYFSKLRSPIVTMNGIMYGAEIKTMEVPGRPREATMNSLYSPVNTVKLYKAIEKRDCAELIFVTNNAAAKCTYRGSGALCKAQGREGTLLQQIAKDWESGGPPNLKNEYVDFDIVAKVVEWLYLSGRCTLLDGRDGGGDGGKANRKVGGSGKNGGAHTSNRKRKLESPCTLEKMQLWLKDEWIAILVPFSMEPKDPSCDPLLSKCTRYPKDVWSVVDFDIAVVEAIAKSACGWVKADL